MKQPVTLQTDGPLVDLANQYLRLRLHLDEGTQVIHHRQGEKESQLLHAPFLLMQRKGGYGDVIPLPPQHIRTVWEDEHGAAIEVSGESPDYSYQVTYTLRAGDRHLTGQVRFKPKVNQVGWFCFGLHTAAEDDHWCYPWISGKRLRCPTVIGRSIGVTRGNHIWTALAGIPALVGRHGDQFYSLGFPPGFDYRDASLTYNDELPGEIRLSLGIRRARGTHVEDSVEEYLASCEYEFPFQVCLGQEGFRDLADSWIRANSFTPDRNLRHTPRELESIFVSGRKNTSYRGARRYLQEEQKGFKVTGYVHGSDDNRIALLKQARNAYIDFQLRERTGDTFWDERAMEQLAFLAAAQLPSGAVRENWDFVAQHFYFQGIDEFGFHPDQQALACEYWFRALAEGEKNGHKIPREWRDAATKNLDWLLTLVTDDGAIPQTVVGKGSAPADQITRRSAGNMAENTVFAATDRAPGEPAPLTRLLSAFAYLSETTGREDVREAMKRHESWVVQNAYSKQCWWGHWPDTNLTTTLYGAFKFIEYCLRRHELTKDDNYLTMAGESAAWCFFQTIPKQLEENRQYTRGAVIEQDNYMQLNSTVGDNLLLTALTKLWLATEDTFFRDMARQYYQTACHAVSDDPRHPWFGSANMYVADPLGLTVPMDTDPATGGATKYAGTIVNTFLEDVWQAEQLGLFATES